MSTLHEAIVGIRTASGIMETFCGRPAQGGPFPAVILFMDVWGVRPELYDVARRIAAEGYCCLVPDVFYRLGRIRFDARDAQGRVISVSRLDKALQAQMHDAISRTPNSNVVADTGSILEYLASNPKIASDKLGCVGYCMGGRHALYAAARFPGRFPASASLHGTGLITDQADSPHLLFDRLQGEVYCGFGEIDPHTPLEMVNDLERIMRRFAVNYRQAVHRGAAHGYALPQRDVYNPHATRRDWEAIFAMFQRQLPARAAS